MPNVVLSKPSFRLKQSGEKLRVMFSPTHSRGGRWNAKYSPELEEALSAFTRMGKIEVITPQSPLTPLALLEMRKSCHVSIDEIVTGSYHQVSLEGLCSGNVVINNSDFFASIMLSNVSGTKDLPPFFQANPKNISERLLELAMNDDLTRHIQKKSFDFFKNNLLPDHLFKVYDNIYKDIL